ncbi:hypothetical protein [Methanotorris igneus]|uniref:Right handed beta helix domain-containing protein n=1 Tax=Methanotorris igneus (strain DSM 5666 / JCM 11834 / Kol 5) TaxID=880724 RepID=F6BBQ6_METIK|nr:hypothetical protein [Methanotorris igneus]AEF96065.1 hypothetical protein Metig_0509 [Methanotorris igneus Kol 5]
MLSYHPTAIKLNNARDVVLRNVIIKNFPVGIVAENSQVSMSRVYLHNNDIGLDVHSSNLTIANSQFSNRGADIVIKGKSRVEIIDTVVRKILNIIGTSSQLDNEALNIGYLAHKILTTTDANEKEHLWSKIKHYIRTTIIKGEYIADWIIRIKGLIEIFGL